MLQMERWPTADRGTLLLAKDKVYHYDISTVDRRETYQISILLAQGYRPAFIAKTINVHRSTVYRELDRNGSKNGYHS
ncbi:helix-turn-helix domain-containing protein [Amphritea opalescens]|uniref:Helix-turn-helix domain-containing protein n=1 Tax=Amphritea opalescens TaxID=2490544 RepID=A0A430KN80_9GAMM|nr:helix-turn-helix domain-containing protein [Amphritea opalescens]